MNYDLKIFEPYVEKGLLRKVEHPTLPLVLFNYTDHCTYEKAWDEVTIMCRGLVLERGTGLVIAKCLPKFWNLNEHETTKMANLPQLGYAIHEKKDGSLGILFHYNNEWHVATRGSFTSDQAIRGKQILKRHEEAYRLDVVWDKEMTLLVEIIYPENKIVSNYGDAEELVAIAGFWRDSGDEISNRTINSLAGMVGIRTADNHLDMSIEEAIALQKTLPKDREGFVVRFENGLRVKIKGDEYMKIARILSNLSPLAFWGAMDGHRVPVEYLEQIPEEYRGEWEPIVNKLESSWLDTNDEIWKEFHGLYELQNKRTKRDIGLFLKENPDKLEHGRIMFAAFDMWTSKDKAEKSQVIEEYIHKHIRPDGNKL